MAPPQTPSIFSVAQFKSKLTQLSPADERKFQGVYVPLARRLNLDPNADDPRHFYDYRGAFKAGKLVPNKIGHFTSEFKFEGHPNQIVDGIDTITGKPVNSSEEQVMAFPQFDFQSGNFAQPQPLTPQQRIQQIMAMAGQYAATQNQMPGGQIVAPFPSEPPLPGMQQAAQPPFPQGMGLRSAQSITGGAPQGQGPLPNFGQSAQGTVPFGANAQAGAPQMDVANMIQSIDQFPAVSGDPSAFVQRRNIQPRTFQPDDGNADLALQLTERSTPATPFTRQDIRAASRARIAQGRTPADRARNLESARRRRELQRIQVQTGRGRFDRAGNFIDEGGKLPWERGPDIAERFDDLKIVPQADRMAIIENDPELKTEMFRRMGTARKEQAETLRQQRLATIDATNTRGDALRERRIASGQLRQNQPRTISPENVAIQAAVKSRRAVQKERSQSLVMQNAQLRRATQQASLGQPFMLPAGAADAGGGVPPHLWQTNPDQAMAMFVANRADERARTEGASKERMFGQQMNLGGRQLDARIDETLAAELGRTTRFGVEQTRLTGEELGRTTRFGTQQTRLTGAERVRARETGDLAKTQGRQFLQTRRDGLLRGIVETEATFGDTTLLERELALIDRELAGGQPVPIQPGGVTTQQQPPVATTRRVLDKDMGQGTYDRWYDIGEDIGNPGPLGQFKTDMNASALVGAGRELAQGLDTGTITPKTAKSIIAAITKKMPLVIKERIRKTPKAYRTDMSGNPLRENKFGYDVGPARVDSSTAAAWTRRSNLSSATSSRSSTMCLSSSSNPLRWRCFESNPLTR